LIFINTYWLRVQYANVLVTYDLGDNYINSFTFNRDFSIFILAFYIEDQFRSISAF